MRAWVRIARTEVLEHRRQPSMLFILAANYLVWVVAFGVVFALFDRTTRDPDAMALLDEQLEAAGIEPGTMLQLGVSTFGSLLFTNLPLFVAITSGYSVLHDRTCGTMPFLMLAPLSRLELLWGKLCGAMAFPLVFHLVFVGASTLLLGRLEALAPFAPALGASPAWWVAFLVGAPASAMLVGALGTVISSLSSDVRTSMQYTSFFIGLLSLGIGFALVDGISQGIGLQLVFAAGCLVLAGLTLLAGARIISRDVVPS